MVESQTWNLSLDALLKELRVTLDGLAREEASRRLARFGPNDALARRRRPLWRQIIDRFANPLILILLFASGLSAWTGEVASCAIIVVIILLSVVIDVAQQWRAESAVEALRCCASRSSSFCSCLPPTRSSSEFTLPSRTQLRTASGVLSRSAK